MVDSARTTLKNPNEAISYLRNIARQYTVFIPGSQSYVDSALDSLEDVSETHGEKFVEIVNRAREELVGIYDESVGGKNKNTQGSLGLDGGSAKRAMEVLKRTIGELRELGKDVGSDVLEKHPQLKDALGAGYAQFRQLAQKGGPEAKKVVDETTKQVSMVLFFSFELSIYS